MRATLSRDGLRNPGGALKKVGNDLSRVLGGREILPVNVRIGHGCIEAPRGMPYHRYEIAADGGIVTAHIVSPTSWNQVCIDADPRDRREQTIRDYDPRISCSRHFLKLAVHRA
jgi:coenzyme F420-reducing hydrogenase alpha subunit